MKTEIVNYSNKKCPDSFFGTIQHNTANNKWEWAEIYSKYYGFVANGSSVKKVTKQKKKASMIILILESPHSAEFGKRGKPICPANGGTGRNIFKHFCDILNNVNNYQNNSPALQQFLNTSQTYDIWLVNSIQKQCSLGIKPINNIIKESNWIDEWFSKGNDFVKRCDSLVKNNISKCFFINTCTKGAYIPMKQIVKDNLEKFILNGTNNYCEGHHPSIWEQEKISELI